MSCLFKWKVEIGAKFILSLLTRYSISIVIADPHSRSLGWGDPASAVSCVTSTTSTCPLVHGRQFEEHGEGSNFQYYVFALCKCDLAIANSFVLVVFIPHQ